MGTSHRELDLSQTSGIDQQPMHTDSASSYCVYIGNLHKTGGNNCWVNVHHRTSSLDLGYKVSLLYQDWTSNKYLSMNQYSH